MGSIALVLFSFGILLCFGSNDFLFFFLGNGYHYTVRLNFIRR